MTVPAAPGASRLRGLGLRGKHALIVAFSLLALDLTMTALSAWTLRATMVGEFGSKGESIAIALGNATEGYLTEDRDASTIQGFVDRFRHLGGVGYIFILDKSGDVIAHTFSPEFPDAMAKAHPFRDVEGSERTHDDAEVDVPGKGRHLDIVVPMMLGRLGEVHVGMDFRVINGEVRKAVGQLVLASLIVFLLALAGVLVFTDRIVRPLRMLTDVAERIAKEGDLTRPIPLVTSNDEVAVLAAAFAAVVGRLRTVPEALRDSVEKLTVASELLTRKTQAQTASLTRQSASVQETSATVREIQETSKLASSKAASVADMAGKAEAIGQSGQRSLDETIARLAEIQAQVETVALRVEELRERTGQVGEITETVKEIATQSKVLSLNAAIEATRAGEHGKGFNVVAREIRALAAESISSTERVRGILDEVEVSIRAVVETSRDGKERVQRSADQVRSGGDNIRRLASVVGENAAAARQISAAVSQQDAGIQQIYTAVNDLNLMLSESVKDLRQTEEIAKELRAIAQGVSAVVNAFRV